MVFSARCLIPIIMRRSMMKWIDSSRYLSKSLSVKLSPTIIIEGLGVNGEDWTEDEEALVRLSLALSQASSLREMLDLVLNAMIRIEGVDCGGFYLVAARMRSTAQPWPSPWPL